MNLSSSASVTASADNRRHIPLIVIVLLMFLAAGGIYSYVTVQDKQDKQYTALLGEQRVLSQRVTKYAGLVTRGTDPGIFEKLKTSYEKFNHGIHLLKSGDPQSGMPEPPNEILSHLNAVDSIWTKFDANVAVILKNQDVVKEMRETVQMINDRSARLLALSDEVATLMANSTVSQEQVYVASRQLMLNQRIVNNVNIVLQGGEGAVTAADRFGRDAALFGRVLDGMLNGNPGMGIQQVKDPGVRTKLEEVNQIFGEVSQQVTSILERTPAMLRVSEAALDIVKQSDQLLDSISQLEAGYLASIERRKVGPDIGVAFGVIGLALLVFLGWRFSDGRARQGARSPSERQLLEARKREEQYKNWYKAS
jgi:twitching motility protein PilJ